MATGGAIKMGDPRPATLGERPATRGRSTPTFDGSETVWHTADVGSVAAGLEVDPSRGLDPAEAQERLSTGGPNRLAGGKKESGFQAFVRQYQDFMQIVLLGAAIINQVVTGDTATSVVLAGLTVFNAVIGLRQESKAEESVAALSTMMKTIARVRRGGHAVEVDAEELVPGDVVLVEAGNRIPADGRITLAATLEIEEAALTGESVPVLKSTEPVAAPDAPLGDRTCMAYMNTSVTRGRGELIVVATGMQTEIGHIANMLATTEVEKTPLQRQLDGLSKIIATIAGVALALVVILGLIRGQDFDTLFITGVALAVAGIPTGLPAVVTALLSIGPIDNSAVTTAGSPVGIAATASATPVMNSVSNDCPRTSPSAMTSSNATPAMAAMILDRPSSCFCSGVLSVSVVASRLAMWPISVPIPVAVTTISPRPRVTEVFIYAMQMRSPSGTSSPGTGSVALATGRLSPVRAASSISRVAATQMRPSAGTRLPASISTTSPGTSPSASISIA